MNNDLSDKFAGLTLEQKIGQMFMARGLAFFPDETRAMLRLKGADKVGF